MFGRGSSLMKTYCLGKPILMKTMNPTYLIAAFLNPKQSKNPSVETINHEGHEAHEAAKLMRKNFVFSASVVVKKFLNRTCGFHIGRGKLKPDYKNLVLPSLIINLLAVSLSGCVSLAPIKGHVLSTTAEQRFTDEAIARDMAAINSLRSRIAAVRPRAKSAYLITRSEALADFGAEEYEENDKTGVLEPLLDEAFRLIVSQELGRTDITLEMPDIPGISRIRPDLWAKIAAIKQDAAKLACAGEPLARLEVGLLELAHEQYEVDTKLNTPEHTLPYSGVIDSLVKNVDDALAACHSATPRHVVFDTDVLFPFNKSAQQDMILSSQSKLDAFAEKLANNPGLWQRMEITGHTDHLGEPAYNQRLGQQRADTIRHYLINHFGLPGERIQTKSMGAAQAIKNCPDIQNAEQLKACLQPNRRVEIDLQ